MENIDDWREAGRIAARALQSGVKKIKPGASMLEVADSIEQEIIDMGAGIAFPTQMSCNHIAAHYCPNIDDEVIFKDQLVCLDVGAHVNGAIGDNARTVDLSGNNSKLVEASEKALENAISILKAGVTLGQIGRAIQDTITSYGFSPINNLGGHGLDLYNIHCRPTVPNFDTGDSTELSDGQIIAIEPFATNGAGSIFESDKATIFALVNKKPVRNMFTRQVLAEIQKYEGLPFTTRWLHRKFPAIKVNFALKELLQLDIIKEYPPLPEKNRGLVSQTEHTMMITEDGCEILTNPE